MGNILYTSKKFNNVIARVPWFDEPFPAQKWVIKRSRIFFMIRNMTLTEASSIHFALLQKAESFDVAHSTYLYNIQRKRKTNF